MTAHTLTVELLTEELPPKALKTLGEAFADVIATDLRARGYLTAESHVTPFATPRRLALSVSHVLSVAPDAEVIDKLMPVKVARDSNGAVSKALTKKLESLGRAHLATSTLDAADGPDRIFVQSDGKADYVYLRSLAKGQPLQQGLQDALDEAIERLPIPKVMSYQRPDGSTVKFVRPAHKLLALHGADVVAVTALGLAAGRVTDGHRFLGRRDIAIATADAYEEALRAEGKVVASFIERRAQIAAALTAAASGAAVLMPDTLLDEVTALVEWPAVYAGTFDPAFLAVPQECLILTMQQNQKYFALADASGKLTSRFLVVSNLATSDPSAIVRGNERVLRARLADARFFFDQDRKQPLESRIPQLANVVYHSKLGSQYERVERIAGIAVAIAEKLGENSQDVERAARLSKADLQTQMVGEFPELQGIMGEYYARHDAEPAEVATAIREHYLPRFSGDLLPTTGVGTCVALSDKIDSLVSLFGAGERASGDRDPYALRRHAVGLIRLIVERKLPTALDWCIELGVKWYESNAPQESWSKIIAAQARARAAESSERGASVFAVGYVTHKFPPDSKSLIADFVYDRLRGYLRDLGYTANQIAAVVDTRPADIHLVPARLAAVQSFESLPESGALAAANKRIVNILRKADSDAATAVDRGRLETGAEHDLWLAFQKLEPAVDADCGRGDFTSALMALATAKPAVDRFFDDVLVMADDPAVRANRLALLRGVAQTMNRVADISKLAV